MERATAASRRRRALLAAREREREALISEGPTRGKTKPPSERVFLRRRRPRSALVSSSSERQSNPSDVATWHCHTLSFSFLHRHLVASTLATLPRASRTMSLACLTRASGAAPSPRAVAPRRRDVVAGATSTTARARRFANRGDASSSVSAPALSPSPASRDARRGAAPFDRRARELFFLRVPRVSVPAARVPARRGLRRGEHRVPGSRLEGVGGRVGARASRRGQAPRACALHRRRFRGRVPPADVPPVPGGAGGEGGRAGRGDAVRHRV